MPKKRIKVTLTGEYDVYPEAYDGIEDATEMAQMDIDNDPTVVLEAYENLQTVAIFVPCD